MYVAEVLDFSGGKFPVGGGGAFFPGAFFRAPKSNLILIESKSID